MAEMAVEGKGTLYVSSAHQREGSAVGQAEVLIGVFLEQAPRHVQQLTGDRRNLDQGALQRRLPKRDGGGMAHPVAQPGHGFVHDVIGRQQRRPLIAQPRPVFESGGMVLIVARQQSDPGAGIDQDRHSKRS